MYGLGMEFQLSCGLTAVFVLIIQNFSRIQGLVSELKRSNEA